ncbi:MAG: transposase, partial [Bacilli bacterium]
VHCYYPKRVLGDRIYQNRENRKYCKELGIRLQGKSAGRKSEDTQQEERRLAVLDNSDRQQIEGLFGELKRKYGMDKLFTKLKENQMLNIGMLVVVRNLEKYINSQEYTSSHATIKSVYYIESYII